MALPSLLADPAFGLDDEPTVSRHLHFVDIRADSGTVVAFHALFGNLAFLDRKLADALIGGRGRPVAELDLPTDVAATLRELYFVIDAGEDERAETERWLADRRELAPTGHFLGGLQITSSNACNFSCSYCFADSSDARSPVRQEAAHQPNISYETASEGIRNVLAIARRHGRDRIGVKFLGREPLVNWKVVRRLLGEFDPSEVAWSLTTNGSLLTPEIAAELQAHDVRTIVSLDGPPAINDKLRVINNKSLSAYDETMRGIEALRDVGHPFVASTVLSELTDYSRMPSFVDGLIDRGADEFELTLVMQVGGTGLHPRRSVDDLATDLVALRRHVVGRGVPIHGDWVDPFNRILTTHRYRGTAAVTRPLGASCSASEHQISLEPSGDLFPCRAMSTHYGHLDDLERLIGEPTYTDVVMRTYYNVPYCQGCQLEGHCQGVCLGSSEEAHGDIYRPENAYCDVYRAVTDELLATLEPPAKGWAGPTR